MLCPNEYRESVLDIDLDYLKEKGISLLLLDLDNTLVEWHKEDISPSVIHWFREAKEKGFNLCILSNNCKERVEKISQSLGVSFIHKAIKPSKRAFRKAMRIYESNPWQTAVIGDQIFTDVLGGNRLGIYTILVTPLATKDFWGTKLVSRKLEKVVLKNLSKKGLLKSNVLPKEIE